MRYTLKTTRPLVMAPSTRRAHETLWLVAEHRYPVEPGAPPVLAVDVGGSHVKAVLNGINERRRFESGPDLVPGQMVERVVGMTEDWTYEAVSVGVPAPVTSNRVVREPANLG